MYQVANTPDATRELGAHLGAIEVDGIGKAPKSAKEGDAVLDISDDKPVLCRKFKGKWITVATRPGVKGGVERKAPKPKPKPDTEIRAEARTEPT